MRSPSALRVVFVVLLLFAQQAAFTHAAWHAGEHRPTQQSEQDASFQGTLCGLHAAFGEVLGAVAGTASPLLLSRFGQCEPAPVFVDWVVLPSLPPRTRGPPAFL
jgi:hypothetical protein